MITARAAACLALMCVTAFPGCAHKPAPAPASAPVGRDAGPADVERMRKELSNWGRWGKDDQLGALNLITPKKRREAAALVRDGVSVSMARNVEKAEAADNNLPFGHEMLLTGLDEGQWCADRYTVAYHGYAHTHMDSLCHIFHEGKIFNGYSRNEVVKEGAKMLGIHKVKNGIFTRAILMDIPRLKGKPYLEPGEAIYPEDLDAWEKKAGVKVSSGDVLMIYTGRWKRRAEKGPWSVDEEGAAGMHVSCVPWFRNRDVAMIGSDAASDVLPSGIEGVSHPVHLIALNAMGVFIFDNCDLEAVAAECVKRKRWAFLITASPLAVEGGTGSPLNPIATF